MTEEQINHDQKLNRREISERYLAFSLCNEQYAIPLLQVKEVIALTDATPVPYAPAYFKGIINLRGQVISVIDLRVKLAFSKSDTGSETSIIILDLKPLCLGVVVDSINSVLALSQDEISPAPEIESTIKGPHITGVARKGSKLTLMLDIREILDVQDVATMEMHSKKEAA